MKLALLSNVNTDYIAQNLKKDYELVAGIGYGDVWGQLLNPSSVLNVEKPDYIVMLPELSDLTSDCFSLEDGKAKIDEWYAQLIGCINAGSFIISDAVYRSRYALDTDDMDSQLMMAYWNEKLAEVIAANINVHGLNISAVISGLGIDNFYSDKMWYMGSIPYTKDAMAAIADRIKNTICHISQTPKKVLVLDMDNTLWGGVLGEDGVDGITLGESKIGAIYRDSQRIIKSMKNKGVMLAICSKNNESDTDAVWAHSHMVLQKEDFVAMKINWQDKSENLRELAKELNVGLDSFVFVDDMPFEREGVRLQLPEVEIPDFPEKKENIPAFFADIYNTYFKKSRTTSEDKAKTAQYMANKAREEYSVGLGYEDFLRKLELKVKILEVGDNNIERIVQLINKTNQFNLTTQRHDMNEFTKMLDEGCKVYAANVSDKFGDYGLVVVAVAHIDGTNAYIDEFLMSCRVMGKRVENCVLDLIEKDLIAGGAASITGKYIATKKNAPVKDFYLENGYKIIEDEADIKVYNIDIKDIPDREYFVEVL